MARRTLEVSEQDKAEMVRMYVSDEKSVTVIGKAFECSGTTVRSILKAKNVTMRPRGRRPNVPTVTPSTNVTNGTLVDGVNGSGGYSTVSEANTPEEVDANPTFDVN